MTAPPDIADRADELTGLIPALVPALTRDNAPPGGRAVLSAGGVVNADVLHAMIMLRAEVPAASAHAAELCGEPWHHRPLDTCLRNLPRFHDRLAATGQPSAAKRIGSSVERWVRVTKLALGLRTPDTPIGWDCPWCDEPSPLIVIGSEGFLRPDQTVTWQHAAAIWCPACGTTWPDSQWEHLGRFLASV